MTPIAEPTAGATNYFKFTEPPKATYRLYLTPSFHFELPGKIPNKFHQWWLKLLMGIELKAVNDPSN